MSTMPTYFLSHGGGPWPYVDHMRPMFARSEQAFKELPARLPQQPKAILAISGHWQADAFSVSTSAHPPMEYDYSGFPEHTYHIRYPAPGSPELAARVKGLLSEEGFRVEEDPRQGFDHGTFVPLVLMYPDADIPVTMLSLRASYDPAEHLRAGRALRGLREEGVLILGSGMTYHNMRGFGRSDSTAVAERFQSYLDAAISQSDWRVRNAQLQNWEKAPDARLAHPREDHLLPLMVVTGAAGADPGRLLFEDRAFQIPVASYEFSAQRSAGDRGEFATESAPVGLEVRR